MKKLLPLLLVLFHFFNAGNAQTPVAYYPFNGNANDAIGTLNGTVNGATLAADRFGNANNAYSFDGVDDFIGLNGSFSGYTQVTVSAWYKVTATSGNLQAIVSSDDAGKFVHMQLMTGSANNIAVYIDNSSNVLLNLPAAALNEWRQLTVTARSGDTRLYENGILISSSNTVFSTISPANLLRIGSGYLNGRFFNGSIDEVKIYNSALTEAQVQKEYSQNAYNSQFGNSIQLTAGNDDYIQTLMSTLLSLEGSVTVEAWVNEAPISTDNCVFMNCVNGGSGYSLFPYIFATFNGNNQVVNSPVRIPSGTWYHIAGVKKDVGISAQISYYVNGVLTGTAFGNAGGLRGAGTNDICRIGKGSSITQNFKGRLDEIRVWNTGRTHEEIAANMLSPLTGDEPGLLGYWDMNRSGQGAGLTVDNKATATGAALNATTFGTATTPVFGPGFTQQKPGSGNAISFNSSSNQQINVANLPISNKSFSIQLWQRRNSFSLVDICISQGTTGTNQGLAVGYYSGSFLFSFYASDLYASVADDLNWHNWTCVYDKSIVSPANNRFIYRDGILVGADRSNSDFIGNTGTFNMGSWLNQAVKGLDGSLDEVVVWDIALTASQIRDRMCRKITSSDALYGNLVAYYNFDESVGNTAFDGSLNGNNGTLTNGPSFVTSGAAIGNASAHDYVTATKTASIAHPGGESLTATSQTGNPNGIQVYRVDEQPNTLTGAMGVGNNNKYFGVFQVAGTSPTYQAVYNYSGNPGVTVGNEIQLRLNKRADNASGNWAVLNDLPDEAANSITVNGESTEYILGKTGFPLPLNMLSFTGTLKNRSVQLQWQTTNEVNRQSYLVERTNGSTAFAGIGVVTALNINLANYSLADNDPFVTGPVQLYRLKIIDKDGRFTYSPVIKISTKQEKELSIFPNPVTDALTISGLQQRGLLKIFTVTGSLVEQQVVSSQTMTFNVTKYPKGTYFMLYLDADIVIGSRKFLKE